METQEFMKVKLNEMKDELAVVKAKLGNRAGEFVSDLEDKVEAALADIDADLHEETEEFKQLGLFGWINANRKAAAVMAVLALVAVNGVLAVFGLHFGL